LFTDAGAVNGNWAEWRDWKCSVGCGNGNKTRIRTCTNPPPSGGGAVCSGEGSMKDRCNNKPCASKSRIDNMGGYEVLHSHNVFHVKKDSFLQTFFLCLLGFISSVEAVAARVEMDTDFHLFVHSLIRLFSWFSS
jgi:hypothetical protein